MRRISTIICGVVLTLAAATVVSADVKMKIKRSMKVPGMDQFPQFQGTVRTKDGQTTKESTVYIKGARQRLEESTEAQDNHGGRMSDTIGSIKQCDLGRLITFNNKLRKYSIAPLSGDAKTVGERGNATGGATGKTGGERGGVVTVKATFTDTGERREMFGLTAWHIKSVTELIPGKNACNSDQMKIETDGWYVDLPGFECQLAPPTGQEATQEMKPGCTDRFEYQVSGKPQTGVALWESRTMSMGGFGGITLIEEAVSVEQTTLDPSLFDIPVGYAETKDPREVSAGSVARNQNASAPQPPQGMPGMPSGTPQPQLPQYAAQHAPSGAADASLGSKKAGMIRIGVAPPVAQVGQGSEGFDPSEAIRNSIVTYLTGPLVEVVPLTSRVEMQIQAEAKQKECDYILYSAVNQKKGGGMFGKLGPVGMIASSMIPMAGAAGATGAVAGMAASTAISAASVAGGFKNKDEITFQYKVVTSERSATLIASTTKAKAKSDGDDVLSPQISQAATAVLSEVSKRKQP